jgi:hypothetical protein
MKNIDQIKANVETLRQDYIKIVNLVGFHDPRSLSMRKSLETATLKLQIKLESMIKLKKEKGGQ